jgi:uncharacterized protein YfaS (alpha-2-macroglobulin family)
MSVVNASGWHITTGGTPPISFDYGASIAGLTITLQVTRPDGTHYERELTVDDEAAGTGEFTAEATDFTVAGIYRANIKIEDSGGEIEDGQHFSFPVMQRNA